MKWFFLIGGIGNLLSMPLHPSTPEVGYLSGILTALMIGVFVISNSIDELKKSQDKKKSQNVS